MVKPVTLDAIREIIAKILYIDDVSIIKDDTSLFSELGLSSIDYVDLCFVLRKEFEKKFDPDDLWPFNKMTADPELFSNNEWTQKGWEKVCSILNISPDTKPESNRDLHKRFTVNCIANQLERI